MTARILSAVLVAATFLIVAVFAVGEWARRGQTEGHETPAEALAEVTLPVGIVVRMEGGFAERVAERELVVRAIAPSLSLTFTGAEDAAYDVLTTVTNVSPDRVQVIGADAETVADRPNAVRFRVALAPDASRRVEVRALVSERFTFFVFGDLGGGEKHARRIFKAAAVERPEFLFHLGDVVHDEKPESLARMKALIEGSPAPFYTAIGNHDTVGEEHEGSAFVRLFGPTYYSFSHGNAFFVVLDNANGYVSRDQLAWLSDELERAARFQHLIVFAHQPPHSPDPDPNHSMKHVFAGAETLMAMVEDAGADVFFSGHLHTYHEERHGGTAYVVTGAAGASMGENPYPYHHYLAVTVDGPALTYEVRPLHGATSEAKARPLPPPLARTL